MQIKKGTKSIENQLIEARNKGLQEITDWIEKRLC